MTKNTKRLFILMADDDAEDRVLFEEILQTIDAKHLLCSVFNGEKLISFLNSALTKGEPMPSVIFLDLNMPVKNGKEALKIIKAKDSDFRHIPVIVFTTSSFIKDVEECYRLGANLFVKKPSKFDELEKTLKDLLALFVNVVELPPFIPAKQPD